MTPVLEESGSPQVKAASPQAEAVHESSEDDEPSGQTYAAGMAKDIIGADNTGKVSLSGLPVLYFVRKMLIIHTQGGKTLKHPIVPKGDGDPVPVAVISSRPRNISKPANEILQKGVKKGIVKENARVTTDKDLAIPREKIITWDQHPDEPVAKEDMDRLVAAEGKVKRFPNRCTKLTTKNMQVRVKSHHLHRQNLDHPPARAGEELLRLR
jgi:hypothetical protein